MTARFAGSRSLDERRRRRLAVDSDHSKPLKGSSPRAATSATAATIEMPRASTPSHFPVRKAISRRLWKIGGVGMIAFASAAAILAAGEAAATQSELFGPGFVRLFGLPQCRAATFFSATQLMLAGQLALLIWWVRSRSLNDFKGRYRVWPWAAVMAFVGAFSLVTDGHLALSETICWLWTEPLWNKEVLCWLVPASVVGLVIVWLLKSDMRECRSSVLMLWLATVCGSLFGVLAIDLQFPVMVDAHRPLIQLGLGMFATVCVFMSMLLHARYVIYNTAEPPQIQPSRFRFPTFRFRERQLDSDGDEATSPATTKKKRSDKPAAKAKASAKPEKQKRRAKNSKPAAAAGLKVVPSFADEEDNQTPAEKPASKVKLQEDSADTLSADIPLDGPPDSEMLKGLSKRERRQLRKQWREQQAERRHA